MIPVIAVVGRSNSGKTTLIEKLLRELKRRGFRIATIKHTHHDIEIDQPGKDTWRHAQAGADIVVISSPKKLAMVNRVDKENTIDDIAALIDGVDLILAEGYKKSAKPKIEVFRSELHHDLLSQPQELLAIASDISFNMGVPCFGLDDAPGIVDLIEDKYLK
ncbi:MAG: molybdopterin-guanine dinucleotide biosynthesis protein B [Bacillota bacterium]